MIARWTTLCLTLLLAGCAASAPQADIPSSANLGLQLLVLEEQAQLVEMVRTNPNNNMTVTREHRQPAA
jgi:hypothetical protein